MDLFEQCARARSVALAQKAQIHRKCVCRLKHALEVPWPRCAGGGKGTGGRSGSATEHGGDATGQRLIDLLRRDEMNVRVDTAGGDDQAFGADDLGAGPDDDVHTGLGIRIARLSNGHNAAVFDTDIGFDDACCVNDQGIGQHQIHSALIARQLRLRHAIADGFAATKLDFLAVTAGEQSVVFLHLDHQIRIRQADPIANGGTEHFNVGASLNAVHKAP